MVDRWQALSAKEGKVDKRMARFDQEGMDALQKQARDQTETYSHRRIILVSDSLTCAHYIKDHSLDFVFIDAHHSYEAVRDDMNAWYRKVRKGGVFSGHDYGSPGRRFGVRRAVDEFMERTWNDLQVNNQSRIWWCKVKI